MKSRKKPLGGTKKMDGLRFCNLNENYVCSVTVNTVLHAKKYVALKKYSFNVSKPNATVSPFISKTSFRNIF